jgi:hypothetical protein
MMQKDRIIREGHVHALDHREVCWGWACQHLAHQRELLGQAQELFRLSKLALDISSASTALPSEYELVPQEDAGQGLLHQVLPRLDAMASALRQWAQEEQFKQAVMEDERAMEKADYRSHIHRLDRQIKTFRERSDEV